MTFLFIKFLRGSCAGWKSVYYWGSKTPAHITKNRFYCRHSVR